MAKSTPKRPTLPPEDESGQDESGKTSGPQSEQGPKNTRKPDEQSSSPPKDAPKGRVGDDDAAEGL